MNLGEYFAEDGGMQILYSAILGGIGGLVGFGCYGLVQSKSTSVKVAALIILLSMSIGAVTMVHLNYSKTELNETEYMTCEVCGYKTLTQNDKFCGECLVEISKSDIEIEGYNSYEEYIIEEQLLFFTPDTLAADINFYSPIITEDGYEKDMNWKPVVSKDSVLELNKNFIEYMKNNKPIVQD